MLSLLGETATFFLGDVLKRGWRSIRSPLFLLFIMPVLWQQVFAVVEWDLFMFTCACVSVCEWVPVNWSLHEWVLSLNCMQFHVLFFVHRSTCEIDSVWSWVNLSAYPQAVSFRTSKLVWGNAHSGSTNQVVLMQDARTHSKLWQPIVKYDPISPNLAGIECCVHTNSRRSAYSPMLISQVNVCAGTVSGWT